jgi:hypothetical protein
VFKSKSKAKLVDHIADAARGLGWYIAIPSKDDDFVPGILIGTLEYIDDMIKNAPDDYIVFQPETLH